MNKEIKEKLMALLLELYPWSVDDLIIFQAEWIEELNRRSTPGWIIRSCETAIQVLIEDKLSKV